VLLTNVSKLEETKPDKPVNAKDRELAEATRAEVLEEPGTDSAEEKSSDDFEFGPGKKGSGKKPKSDLVKYLEAKNEVFHVSIAEPTHMLNILI